MVRNRSCPAVSQICSLTVFLSIFTVRNRKSTPIVDMYDSVKASSWIFLRVSVIRCSNYRKDDGKTKGEDCCVEAKWYDSKSIIGAGTGRNRRCHNRNKVVGRYWRAQTPQQRRVSGGHSVCPPARGSLWRRPAGSLRIDSRGRFHLPAAVAPRSLSI